MSIPFLEWFDTNNRDHILAYKHLIEEGLWPNGFLPQNVKMEHGWYPLLASKLANAYVKEFLKRGT